MEYDYENPTLASMVAELFRLIFTVIGEDFGGGAVIGVVMVACVLVAWRSKGIVGWIAVIFGLLMCVGAAMNKGFPLGEAVAGLCFFGGLFQMVVVNLIAIIMGHYWKIKTNLITGGVWMVLGVAISALAG